MRGKFITWVKEFRPPFLLSVLGAILFAGLSLVDVATEWLNRFAPIVSYVVYVCAAIFLALATWAIVLWLKKTSPKQQFLEAAGKNPFTARLTQDYTYRTVMAAFGSLGFNIILISSKLFAGWYYASTWLMVLAGYYMILCLSKALLLRFGRNQRRLGDKTVVHIHEWQAYRLCGIMLILMTVFLQGVVIMIVKDGTGFSYNEIVVIAIAAYDFWCLGNAVYYIVRKRKNHSPIVNSLKLLSFAASLVAILSLQTAMFSSFGGEEDGMFKSLMNIGTGTCVCAALIAMGVLAIVRANKELKKII